MKIKLDPKFSFVTKDGKYNQRDALINAGVKAAVCFRDGEVTPEIIRATETEEQLILRGLNTILSDHTTPSEHPNAGLEVTNIPKILCMILNNEHQYTTCERSLRYTEVKPGSEYLSELEFELYKKWLDKFQIILSEKYSDYFKKYYKTEKAAETAIKKLAQENARYLINVFMPTTLTYTVPFAQINKIALYMQKLIDDPNKTELQELSVPYMEDFINQLKDLKVLVLNSDAKRLCPELKVEDNDKLFYKNNKDIDLSLFAERNKFSGIYLPEEFGVGFSYNFYPSFASLAQFHRHRTIDFEMIVEDEYKFYIPPMILDDKFRVWEWVEDMRKVRKLYPQGQLVRANASGSLKNLIQFVGKERACDCAQLETQDQFTNTLIPLYYAKLLETNKTALAEQLAPYVEKLRCQYADYHCPRPCGHPRVKRDF